MLGPTAGGKSALAEFLSENFGGELINSDASAVYRELSVGVTKPGRESRQRFCYHLLDVTTLEQGYTLMDYITAANACIDEITSRGKVPILVGGSSLYARAVLDGYRPPTIEVPDSLRREVRELSLGQALNRLESIDPDAWKRIDRKNPRRVTRALELALAVGGPVSPPESKPRADLQIFRFVLSPTKEVLDARIRQRTLQMWEPWVKEVDQLEKKGLARWLEVRKPIGYCTVLAYLHGEMEREQAIDEIVAHTIKLAKKQRTWLKGETAGPFRYRFELSRPDQWSQVPELALKLLRGSLE